MLSFVSDFLFINFIHMNLVLMKIRASERRFYQKITDIYAECSMDYDPESEITRTFVYEFK